MKKWGQKQTGFTIVELLIVIVVIAILAAVSVVAYNGIQTRARNSQLFSGVTAYTKAITQYQAINSSLPTTSGCLGAGYPANECWNGVSGTVTVTSALDTQLAEFVPSKPTLVTSLPVFDSQGSRRGGLVYLANYPSAGRGALRFYLEGSNQNCTVAGYSGSNELLLTSCEKFF